MRLVQLAILAALATAALPMSPAEAAVFCRRGTRLAIREGACKRKETTVNLADFGAVGPKGDPGAQGPPGPSSAVSSTVTGLGPSGSQIVNDDDTGLEVTWGLNGI